MEARTSVPQVARRWRGVSAAASIIKRAHAAVCLQMGSSGRAYFLPFNEEMHKKYATIPDRWSPEDHFAGKHMSASLGKRRRQVGAGVLGLAMIAPAVAWEAIARGVALPSPPALAGVAYLGLLPTLVAMLLFAHGIARVGPVQAGLFTHLVPVFGAVFATLLLGERLQPFHAVGFALVAGGAILGCLKPEAALARATLAATPTRSPARAHDPAP